MATDTTTATSTPPSSTQNFLKVGQPNFLEGVPSGPTGLDLSQLSALYNQIPFVNEPFISKTRNTRCGRGMLCPVTGAALTKITITHNLGRVVQGLLCISNGANNELFTAQMALWPGGQNTPKLADIQGNLAMVNAIVWFI